MHPVDENLFYKGVDKSRVDPGRLSQSYVAEGGSIPIQGPADTPAPEPAAAETKTPPLQPRYLFHSGNSLLAMTRKHNVSGLHLPLHVTHAPLTNEGI